MEVSDLTIRIFLLFFPGLICAYVVDTFTVHRPRTPFYFILQSFIYGFSSYLLYWILALSAHKLWPALEYSTEINFLHALTDRSVAIDYKEILYVSALAVLLGLAVTTVSTYKVHFWIAHKLHITKKFGELDVWGFVFNSEQVEWVTVRDHKNDLVYDGWVKSFSDDSENAEVLLRDVAVYKNATGEHLYDVGAMYLSLDRRSIAIEFRDVEVGIPVQSKANEEKRRGK